MVASYSATVYTVIFTLQLIWIPQQNEFLESKSHFVLSDPSLLRFIKLNVNHIDTTNSSWLYPGDTGGLCRHSTGISPPNGIKKDTGIVHAGSLSCLTGTLEYKTAIVNTISNTCSFYMGAHVIILGLETYNQITLFYYKD